jgi:5-formyltetrahydrofolate cyclo-ligase
MSGRSEKQAIRQAVWSRLEDAGAALFPGARGRIPNFKGAAAAAERLATTEAWREAQVVKCNPDAPQRPVRLRALREGKTVYMAVPRLRDVRCFWELDPRRLPDLARAATIAGASRLGRPVDPRRLPRIDLVIAGSVAVNRRGERVGKGGGYSDLEYAIGREVGGIDDRTVVATTVHPLQVLPDALPVTAHDFELDLVVTPDQVIVTGRSGPQPPGILDDHLTEAIRAEVPILKALGHG